MTVSSVSAPSRQQPARMETRQLAKMNNQTESFQVILISPVTEKSCDG